MTTAKFDATEGAVYLYDDPYKILATILISRLSLGELYRFMTDNKYTLQVIVRDVQGADINSSFLDCLQDVLFRKSEKVKYKKALATLAYFCYSNLDIARLRQNIADFLEDCGIIMVEGG